MTDYRIKCERQLDEINALIREINNNLRKEINER